MDVYVIGIDPGLVDTGIIIVRFNTRLRTITVTLHVDTRGNGASVVRLLDSYSYIGNDISIFIEGYRARSHFDSDTRMLALVQDIKKATNGTVLPNMGIKKVVKGPLLDILKMRKFGRTTHHADLESAARILVLGMLKDERLNLLLSDILNDHLKGKPWGVFVR